jgi:hypothetical protein
MMTDIRGASNAKANRELAWNPAHPSWREGFRGIDEQVATIVFATPAVSKWIEDRTGWSIKRFVCTARRYRTIEIQAGTTSSPPPTPCPATSMKPSATSTTIPLRTN